MNVFKTLVCFLVMVAEACTSKPCTGADEAHIGVEEAVTIGYNAVKQEYAHYSRGDAVATYGDTPWNDCLPIDSLYCNNSVEYWRKLANRRYWMVRFEIKDESLILGGNPCVFVDYNSGKVIAVLTPD